MSDNTNDVNNESVVVKPIEQVVILLFGCPVRAVRLPDGRIAAVFVDLTDALHLDRASQARRVYADETTADQLFLAEIAVESDDDGNLSVEGEGVVPMGVLTAWAIPIWLTGIQLGKLAPAKRPAVLAFKREAADVLYRHFSQPHEFPDALLPALPAPTISVVPASVPQPDKPTPDAGRAAWIDYYQAMAAWLEWQDDMDRWRAESTSRAAQLAQRQTTLEARQDSLEDRMETRMEGVEELSRLFVDVTRALPPLTLTSAHQATVKAMAGRLHDVGSFAYSTIYGDLNAAFHVGKYIDIPESNWADVVQWLQTRLDAAQRRS